MFVIPKFHTMFTKGALQEMPSGCSPGGVIFFSILTEKIANYGYLPKTLNLTPPELMRNPDWAPLPRNELTERLFPGNCYIVNSTDDQAADFCRFFYIFSHISKSIYHE